MIQNRKARHEYHIIKEYVAGIQLIGSEVKSIRNHNANINDSFVYISDSEIFIKGMHIAQYKQAVMHDENRVKKLLLNKKEIIAIASKTDQPSYTIIPLEVFDMGGKLKVRIAIAQGKKLYDKKQSLKEKDIKLQTERELNIR